MGLQGQVPVGPKWQEHAPDQDDQIHALATPEPASDEG